MWFLIGLIVAVLSFLIGLIAGGILVLRVVHREMASGYYLIGGACYKVTKLE